MVKLNRRHLLFTAIGAMSVLAARDFFLVYCRGVARNVPTFFAGLDLPKRNAARQVGIRVAAAHPGRGAEAELSQVLEQRPLLLAASEESCPDTRLAMVQQQCCEDFVAGRTLVVDGWVLSETEARLCAANFA